MLKKTFDLDDWVRGDPKTAEEQALEAGVIKRRKRKVKPPLPSERDPERAREVAKKYSSRRTNKRYYQKNREKLNSRRRARAATLRGTFLTSRARAKRRGQNWEITQEEWNQIWGDAPDIYDETLMYKRRPFVMRGPNPHQDVQFARIDDQGSWRYNNVCIKYKDVEQWRPREEGEEASDTE